MGCPKVYAITLNWNGRDDTIECIKSLKKSEYTNFQIVVVDNGSTDGSVPALRAEYPDVIVIENGQNLGYAEGFNTGMRHALQEGADYFLIINNDTVIDPRAIGALVSVAEQNPRTGFVSGKVYFYDEPNRLQTVGRARHPILMAHDLIGHKEIDVGQYDEVRERDFIDDVFLLVRRTVFEEVGGYDPTFFLMYEETDWCARVRRAGFKIIYTPDARIWHKGNKETSAGRSTIHQFYLARNQIPFMRRNASPPHFRLYLRTLLFSYKPLYAPRQAWRLLKRGEFRLLMAYLQGIGSGLLWLWFNRHVAWAFSEPKVSGSPLDNNVFIGETRVEKIPAQNQDRVSLRR
jgi:GT2 family glycosyltransferase